MTLRSNEYLQYWRNTRLEVEESLSREERTRIELGMLIYEKVPLISQHWHSIHTIRLSFHHQSRVIAWLRKLAECNRTNDEIGRYLHHAYEFCRACFVYDLLGSMAAATKVLRSNRRCLSRDRLCSNGVCIARTDAVWWMVIYPWSMTWLIRRARD